jgi:Cft2 family RNA processing exonuclease
VRLTFLGAAGDVTGSCDLAQAGGARFLIDCGMVQAGRLAARPGWPARVPAIGDTAEIRAATPGA